MSLTVNQQFGCLNIVNFYEMAMFREHREGQLLRYIYDEFNKFGGESTI